MFTYTNIREVKNLILYGISSISEFTEHSKFSNVQRPKIIRLQDLSAYAVWYPKENYPGVHIFETLCQRRNAMPKSMRRSWLEIGMFFQRWSVSHVYENVLK